MEGLSSEAVSWEVTWEAGHGGKCYGLWDRILMSLQSAGGTGDTYNAPLAYEPPPYTMGEGRWTGKGG